MIRVLAGYLRRDTARVHRSASAGGKKVPTRQYAVNLGAAAGSIALTPAGNAGRRVAFAPAGSGRRRAARARAVILCAATAFALGGCWRVARAINDVPPGEWTARMGDASHTAYINERVPERVRIEWEKDHDRGFQVPVFIHGDLLIGVAGNALITARATTGVEYWSRRFNALIAGQVLRIGPAVYFATQHRNGTLYSMDLHRGRRQWSDRIGAPAAAEPAYADGQIYLGTNREIQAYAVESGEVLWRTRIGGAPLQPPVVHGSELIIARGDSLFRIRRSDGRIDARIGLPGEPSAPLALRGDTLVVAMNPGIVAAYVDGGGRELWRHTLDAHVIAAPVVTDDGVFVLTRAGDLHLLGETMDRRVVALDGAATESLTIVANGALIGLLDGRLVFVQMDGRVVWEMQLDGSVRAPAAVHGSEIYVGTLDGQLVKLTEG